MAIRFDNIELNYIKNLQEETVITINANQSVLFQSDVTASSGNITAGAVGKASDTVMRVLAGDSNKAGFEAYGNSQGTGYLYVGQSSTYGGGISYNGDNSPSFISGESSDRITFFRRNAGTSSEVFNYSYIADNVYFNGDIAVGANNTPLNFGFLERVIQINAGSSSSSSLQQAGLVISGSSDADDADDFGYISFVNHQSTLSNDRVAEIRAYKSGTDVNTGQIRFFTANGTSLTQAVEINQNGDVIIEGNLTVSGTTTTLNTTTVEVEDNILQLNTTQGSPDTATATTSGISIYRGSGVTQASFIFDDADDTWDLTNNLNVAGNVIISNDSTLVIPSHSGFEIEVTGTHAANFRANSTLYLLSQTGSIHLGSGGTNGRLILDTSGDATFAGDVTVNGSHLTLANGTTAAQSTDYLYIGGSNLGSADAAIYIGNSGNGSGYGYRIYYSGIGSGNNNKLIFKSENVGTNVDMLSFTADGNATFAGRTELQKDLRLRGNDASGNLGVVRFLTDANNQLIIDTGNDGSNRTIIDGSGNLTVAGSIKLEGPDGGLVFRNWTASSAYASIATNSMTGSEYALLTDGTNTFLSGGNGGYVSIRGGDNNTAHQLIITATEAKFYGTVIPNSNATQNFGSSSNRWNIGYFSSLRITNVVTNKILKFDGQDIDDSLLGDDGTTVSSGANFIPITDSTYDLGTTTNYWRNLYVDNIISEGGDAEVQKVYKDTVTINNSTYTTIATVSGNSLASGVRLNVTGTSNSVVINVDAKILVNHYKDILIKSTCAYYRKIFIKVVSDNNEDFAIELKRDTAGSTTTTNVNVEIIPLSSETITFTNSHSFTGTTHEHFTQYGEIQSSNDDAGNDYHYWLKDDGAKLKLGADGDMELYHDGSNSHIINTTGDLTIDSQGDDLILKSADDALLYVQGSDIAIQAVGDGKVGLRYDNVEKLATTSTGVTVTGNFGIGTTTPDEEFSVIGSAGLYGTVSSGIISPASLTFYTSEDGAGLGDSTNANKQKSGEIIWYGKDASLNAAGEYASIESYIIDSNNLIQGSANEGGQIEFNIWRHDVSAETRVKYTALVIDNDADVGIGTTTPTAPLHIEGGTTSEVLKIEADSNPFIRWVENGTNVGFLQFLGDSAYLSNMSNGSLFFRTNNTDKMTITSGGNVGIGTTSPSDGDLAINDPKLHVQGPTGSGAYHLVSRFQAGSDADNTGAAIAINHSNDRGLLIRAGRKDSDREVAYFDLISSGGGRTNLLTLGRYGSDTYSLFKGGNVGIGNFDSPNTLLHIYDGAASNAATTDLLKLEAYTGDFGLTPAAIALAFKFQDSNNLTNEARIRMATVNDTDYGDNDEAASNLIFSTTNAGTESDKMIITGRGDIGIGTVNPSATLELNSTTGNAAKLRVGRQTTATNYLELGTDGGSSVINAIGIAGVNASLIFNRSTTTTTTESMRIDSSGNVGIGVTSPSEKLDVNGNIRLRTGVLSSNNGTISHSTNNLLYVFGGSSGLYLSDNTGQQNSILIHDTNYIDFQTAATRRLRIDSSGRMLVGLAGSGNIYVGGQTSGQYFRIHHNNSDTYLDGNGGKIYFRGDSGANTRFEMDMTGTNAGQFIASGDIVAFGSPSDKTLKENIKPIENALDKVNKLEGVEFNWKEQGITNLNEDIGFIAQDVQEVLPQLVRKNENGKLSLRHQGIVPVLVEAIKELTKEIETLKTQINN